MPPLPGFVLPPGLIISGNCTGIYSCSNQKLGSLLCLSLSFTPVVNPVSGGISYCQQDVSCSWLPLSIYSVVILPATTLSRPYSCSGLFTLSLWFSPLLWKALERRCSQTIRVCILDPPFTGRQVTWSPVPAAFVIWKMGITMILMRLTLQVFMRIKDHTYKLLWTVQST